MPTLYLDTTVPVDRLFGHSETVDCLKQICGQNPLISSTYVWDEFRKTVLHDFVTCHACLLNAMARGKSLQDGLRSFKADPQLSYRPRRRDRGWDITILLQGFQSIEGAVDRLEKDIRWDLRHVFFQGLIQPLQNGTDCKMTAIEPVMIPSHTLGGYPRFELPSGCNKASPPSCQIMTFWKRNREAFRLVADMEIPAGLRKDTRHELSVLREEAGKLLACIDTDPNECYGKRCYAVFADLVITLDCPPTVPIVTRNDRHFAPLCSTLSRPEPISYR